MKQLVLNKKGMTLTQVMIMMGIISAFSVAIMSLMENQRKIQHEMNLKTSLTTIRQNMMGTIGNFQAWAQTKSRNAGMTCTSQNQNFCRASQTQRMMFALYDSSGAIVYDARVPTNGFTSSGQRCNTYSAAGNDACPVRVDIEWRSACLTSNCVGSEDFVTMTFRYSPRSSRLPLNTGMFDLSEQTRTMLGGSDSPFQACAKDQMIFIGVGKSFNGFAANPQGCVAYTAFRGPQGVQGATGSQGPQGASGANAYCPACPVCPSGS